MSSKSMSGMFFANHSSIGLRSKRFSALSRNFVIHSGSDLLPRDLADDLLVQALLGLEDVLLGVVPAELVLAQIDARNGHRPSPPRRRSRSRLARAGAEPPPRELTLRQIVTIPGRPEQSRRSGAGVRRRRGDRRWWSGAVVGVVVDAAVGVVPWSTAAPGPRSTCWPGTRRGRRRVGAAASAASSSAAAPAASSSATVRVGGGPVGRRRRASACVVRRSSCGGRRPSGVGVVRRRSSASARRVGSCRRRASVTASATVGRAPRSRRRSTATNSQRGNVPAPLRPST